MLSGTRSATCAWTRDIAIEAGDLAAGGLGLGCGGGGIRLIEEHLALQVALFDEIAVDEDERAHPGARQQRCCCCSGRPAADHGHGSGGEAPLSRFANRREEYLPRVAAGVCGG